MSINGGRFTRIAPSAYSEPADSTEPWQKSSGHTNAGKSNCPRAVAAVANRSRDRHRHQGYGVSAPPLAPSGTVHGFCLLTRGIRGGYGAAGYDPRAPAGWISRSRAAMLPGPEYLRSFRSRASLPP
jgi:hypothetical protein